MEIVAVFFPFIIDYVGKSTDGSNCLTLTSLTTTSSRDDASCLNSTCHITVKCVPDVPIGFHK